MTNTTQAGLAAATALAAMLSAGCAPASSGATASARVGTFNRTELLKAYYGSPLHEARLDHMRAERDAARAAGDEEQAKAIEARGAALQDYAHRQLAGEASLINVREDLDAYLDAVGREASVDVIVEEPWFLGERAQTVDVTDRLAAQLRGAKAGAGAAAPVPAKADEDAALLEDAYHPQIPPENVRDVMTSKLAHTHALLEGMSLEDFDQIEVNATALRFLSHEAGWRVHTTLEYGLFSDEFAEIAGTLAERAREHDIAGVTAEYMRLTGSCMRCHEHLRGLYKDVPGRVSSRAPFLGGRRGA